MTKNISRFIQFLFLVLLSLSSTVYAEAGVFTISCEGTTTRSGITFGGVDTQISPRPDTQTFKIGPNSINSRECQVSTDAMLVCEAPKARVESQDPNNTVSHLQTSKMLNRYSGKIISKITFHFSSGTFASQTQTFTGTCRKVKKRF
jgi:hypothetical protein